LFAPPGQAHIDILRRWMRLHAPRPPPQSPGAAERVCHLRAARLLSGKSEDLQDHWTNRPPLVRRSATAYLRPRGAAANSAQPAEAALGVVLTAGPAQVRPDER